LHNNKSPRRLILFGCAFIIILCLTTVAIIVVFDPFIDQVRRYPDIFTTDSDFHATGSYTIKADTILGSLANGQKNIFLPLLATPEALVNQNQILWHQSDYIQIANAVFEYQWKEPASGWKLYRMLFDTDCQNDPSGFSHATIAYFKSIWVDHTLEYTVRQIEIYPQYNEIDWGGDSFNYPHPILGWPEIDLQRLRIQADDALRIAEEDGGKAARLHNQNKCSVNLVLYGDSTWGWDIFYNGNGGFIYQMYVDPYTKNVRR
jgi:hypothetical protein